MLDLLIRGGRVVDGSGNPWYRADVGVRADRIVAVGVIDEPATRTIDAGDRVVCPGFTDMHTHSDLVVLANPLHEAKVMQGVTLDVIGQDGLALAPVNATVREALRSQLGAWNGDAPVDRDWSTVAEYLARFDEQVAVNVAYLIPHGTIRMLVMGMDDRAPTPDELAAMQRHVAQGIAEGGFGLSTGLTYAPAMYASDDEIVALCSVMRGSGGFYCPHHRNYGMRAIEAYGDCIEIARRAGVPLHLAHAHLGFAVNKGRAGELLGLIDAARADGVDITLDSYPYLAGATYLHAFLPGWAHAGGPAATIARLRDPDLRDRLRVELEETGSDGYHDVPIDWSTIVVSGVRSEANRPLVGRSVADAAATAGVRPIDLYCDLLASDELGVSGIAHFGNEENVRATMQHPVHTAGSDGIIVGERPHPRGWGTFPRYLGVYVRELGVLTLEQAIRKMTSLPAQRLGLADRGLVRPGMAADLVVLDPDEVIDTATYEDPKRYPLGIDHVVVNGRLVVEDRAHTGALPGRALRRTAGGGGSASPG